MALAFAEKKGWLGNGAGRGKSGGKGGKTALEAAMAGYKPETVLGQFCKDRGTKPTFIFTPNGPAMQCNVRMEGLAMEGVAVSATKQQAQIDATLDFVKKLYQQGLNPKMPSKRQLEEEPQQPAGPSWAIQGGAADVILPEQKKAKGKGKDKSEGDNTGERAPGRNIDAEYTDILNCVRAGDVAAAIRVLEDRLCFDKRVFTVRQFGIIVTSIGVRSPSDMVSVLLSKFLEYELVDFSDPAARSYFGRFATWAAREFLAEGQATLASTESTPLATLERNGVCIPQLQASPAKHSDELALQSSGPLPSYSHFMRGDWLFLTFPHTARVGAADGSSGTLPATVEAENMALLPVGQHGIVAKIIGVKPEFIQDLVGKYCRVDRAANHVTFNRQVDGLRVLCTAAGELGWLRQILLNADEPNGGGREAYLCSQYHGGAACPGRFDILSLANPSQYEALKAGTSQRFTLIQGPPGSGKTSTALLLIQLWIAANRGPVLAAADSNVAVDNVVSGCAKAGINVVRVGRQEATRPDLDEFNLMERAKLVGKGSSGERNHWEAEKKILANCDVVCCTCSGAAHPVMQDMKFQCVLIDEAGQATELAQIVPLLHLSGNGSAALVGDHKQLPPTVACLEADVEGLGTSLFERLASLGVPPLLLDTQYRMHPAIAAYPSQEFYGGCLRSGVSGALRPAPQGIIWPVPYAPVAFLPIQSMESREGNSFVNDAEATAVDTVLSAMINWGDIPVKDIGVITPYAAQARLLRRRFGCPAPGKRIPTQELIGHAACEVSSVDGFQGREKELIIVSTVRANPRGNVGFLSDPRRLNVMLTRARRGMLVIGHFETLARDANGWQPFLIWAQQRGLVAGCPATCEEAVEELKELCDLSGDALLNWQPKWDDEPME